MSLVWGLRFCLIEIKRFPVFSLRQMRFTVQLRFPFEGTKIHKSLFILLC